MLCNIRILTIYLETVHHDALYQTLYNKFSCLVDHSVGTYYMIVWQVTCSKIIIPEKRPLYYWIYVYRCQSSYHTRVAEHFANLERFRLSFLQRFFTLRPPIDGTLFHPRDKNFPAFCKDYYDYLLVHEV